MRWSPRYFCKGHSKFLLFLKTEKYNNFFDNQKKSFVKKNQDIPFLDNKYNSYPPLFLGILCFFKTLQSTQFQILVLVS